MNDDFEKQLQRQPLREVPGAWREEILRTAQTGAETSPVATAPAPGLFLRAGLKLWRELIRPCRHAWTGLAAVWLVIAALNAGTSASPHTPVLQTASAPAPAEVRAEQRRLLAELIPSGPKPPAEPPRRQPAPRSDRGPQSLQA